MARAAERGRLTAASVLSGLVDAHGNAVATASRPALEASERALWRAMSFYGTPIDDLDAAIAADPAWALPHAMKAGFLLGLTEPTVRADALATLAAAERLAGHGNDRERAHVGALRRLADGDWAGAGDAWNALLARHPRDAVALQWGHLLDFYRGDATMLRERVERILPTWNAADPLHPYVLGLHAFGLEECHRHDEAEAIGRQALAGNARVPWAIHAVAHVMEMGGRHVDGRRWMADWREHWGAPDGEHRNGFAGHLGWHEALFALESLDYAGALAAYDRFLPAAAHEITLQRVDAASLLWRFHLLGVDVGPRWQALVDGWSLDVRSAGQSAFNDLHALVALLGADGGDTQRAEAWLEASIAQAAARPGWNRGVMARVGAPLMHGFLAFGQGRFDDAADRLVAVRDAAPVLGGSHAQRDVIEQTLLAACAEGSRHAVGRALFEARFGAPRDTPLGAWWARRLDLRVRAAPALQK